MERSKNEAKEVSVVRLQTACTIKAHYLNPNKQSLGAT